MQGICKDIGESGVFRNIKVSEKNNINFADVSFTGHKLCFH